MKLTNFFFVTLLGITIPTQLSAMVATHPASVTPEQTVYVFDIHDVTAIQNRRIAYAYAWAHKFEACNFLRLVGSLALYGINRGIKFNRRMLCIDYAILNGVKNISYINYALNILNPFTINQETVSYARSLQATGSQIFLFSNIGQQSFNFMNSKNELEPVFNGKYICAEANNFTTKRSPEAFKKLFMETIVPAYQAQYPGKYPKRIVMIDDSPKKIVAAQQGLVELQKDHPEFADTRLVPVVFKNVEQMKADVQALI